jgi:hypothetical protein
MGLALRRKLAAKTGIPERVLNAEDFWGNICGTVSLWAEKFIPGANDLKLNDRVLIGSEALQDQVLAPFSYLIGRGDEDIIGAIRVNKFCAAKHGASRLGVELSDLTDVPDIFLTLVFEKSLPALFTTLQRVLTPSVEPVEEGNFKTLEGTARLGRGLSFMQINFDLKIDDREVQINLWLKYDEVRHATESPDEQRPLPAQDSGARTILASHVKRSGMTFHAIVDRISLTLGECVNLSIGQVLPLSEASLERLSLSVSTLNGDVTICNGELGSWKNNRALKIQTEPDAGFLQNVGEI